MSSSTCSTAIDILFPATFFFYGSLQDPQRLAQVLRHPVSHVPLQKAKLRGYKMMLWGQYPALAAGAKKDSVEGMICSIDNKEDFDKIQAYESDNYRSQTIDLKVGGKKFRAVTFVWANEHSGELQEGSWNLEIWQQRWP